MSDKAKPSVTTTIVPTPTLRLTKLEALRLFATTWIVLGHFVELSGPGRGVLTPFLSRGHVAVGFTATTYASPVSIRFRDPLGICVQTDAVSVSRNFKVFYRI